MLFVEMTWEIVVRNEFVADKTEEIWFSVAALDRAFGRFGKIYTTVFAKICCVIASHEGCFFGGVIKLTVNKTGELSVDCQSTLLTLYVVQVLRNQQLTLTQNQTERMAKSKLKQCDIARMEKNGALSAQVNC